MSTGPVATCYTYEFIRGHLPTDTAAILEIGCGEGELAGCLLRDGAQVVALDSDEMCVANARTLGVDARLETWPSRIEDTFDCVLFTRSLHHITPLDDAIAAATEVLRPGGKIIVEDFRVETASARNDAWFGGLMRLFDATGILHGKLSELLEKLDLTESRHHLHSSLAMERELSRSGQVQHEDAAYYFRYAEPVIDRRVSELLLAYELSLIKSGAIDALGKRYVLTRPPN